MLDPLVEAAENSGNIPHNLNSTDLTNDMPKNSTNSNNPSDVSSNKNDNNHSDTDAEKSSDEKIIQNAQDKHVNDVITTENDTDKKDEKSANEPMGENERINNAVKGMVNMGFSNE
uniref:Uncharacterized protein n=1 Tax=Glossina austeni TaxID=7395 RepID=A0A1A9UWP7_GLOAU